MNKKIFKRIGILSLGLLCAVGIITGVTLSQNKTLDSEMIVNTDVSNNNLFKITQRKNLNNPNTVTLTAEVEAFRDVTLEWTNKFTDGTPASSYVSMTVSSDTKSVTLKYLQPFSKKINITASVSDRSEITATCVLDCYTRHSIKTVTFTENGTNVTVNSQSSFYDVDSYVAAMNTRYVFNGACTVNSVGTVNSTYNMSYKIHLTDEYKARLSQLGLQINDTEYNAHSSFTILDVINSYIPGNKHVDDYYDAVNDVDAVVEVECILESSVSGDVFNTDKWVIAFGNMDFSDYYNSSITFDKTNIIF